MSFEADDEGVAQDWSLVLIERAGSVSLYYKVVTLVIRDLFMLREVNFGRRWM